MGKSDWLSGKRAEQLKMAKDWSIPIKSRGKSSWGMDDELIAKFEDAVTSAENEYQRPANTRNTGTNILLKEAFDELVKVMREIKRRFLHNPPLTNKELSDMGLKLKTAPSTAIGIPSIRPQAKVSVKGDGILEFSVSPSSNILDDKRSYHGWKIAYAVFEQSATPPTDAEDLRKIHFTRKKTERFVFPAKDSAKKMYYCLRYENSKGQAGEWTKIFSVNIP
jgi:hypothetical protein